MAISKIDGFIHLVRGRRVILDTDLAGLYGVTTGNLNKAVGRNLDRFPSDFMLTLTREEYQILRFQFGSLRWGAHSKYSPRVFTQEGVAMLSGVLNSPRAVQVNVAIMRAFVRLQSAVAAGNALAERTRQIERTQIAHERELGEHAVQIHEVFAAMRRMTVSQRKKGRPSRAK